MSKAMHVTWTARQRSILQLIRYAVLGVLTNTAGYMLYLGITHLGVGSKVAMTALYCLGVCISFFGNRAWVFSSDRKMLSSTVRYVAAYAVGYVVNYSILWNFVDRLGYPHVYVQAVSIVIVAAYLFVAFKFFVFPPTDVLNGNIR